MEHMEPAQPTTRHDDEDDDNSTTTTTTVVTTVVTTAMMMMIFDVPSAHQARYIDMGCVWRVWCV